MIAAATGGVGTWNAADKDADITLSNGDTTATGTNAGAVRGLQGRDLSENRYFEVYLPDTERGQSNTGLMLAASSLAAAPGAGDGFGARLAAGPSMDTYYNGGGWNSPYVGSGGASVGGVDTIGVWINGGAIKYFLNGATNASPDQTGRTGVVYPAWGRISGTPSATLNTGATAFVYSLPSGATAWG